MDNKDPLSLTANRRLFDEVYTRLRSAIITGYLAPGARVVEREITERLQVSRTPIREAMKQLEQEGLLVCYPHKGCFVRSPTFEEARQAYELRTQAEGFSAELAAQRASEEELQALVQTLRESDAALKAGDRPAQILQNNAFHQILVKAARNRFLEEELQRLWAYVDILRYHYWEKTDRAHATQAEHQAILAALLRRDGPACRRLMEEHVVKAWELLASQFPRSASEAESSAE